MISNVVQVAKRFTDEQRNIYLETLDEIINFKKKYENAEGRESKDHYRKHLDFCLALVNNLIELSDEYNKTKVLSELDEMSSDEIRSLIGEILQTR